MKKIILALAAVAFLAAPAMAQADIYVSPEAQKAMNARGYTVEPWTPPMTPPAQDKYCPGQKVTGHAGIVQRNSNGGTTWHIGLAGTFCYMGNGDRVWARVKGSWFGAPSVYFERLAGPRLDFKRGTLWSWALVRERERGTGWSGEDKTWNPELFLNPEVVNGHLKVREGGRIRGGN